MPPTRVRIVQISDLHLGALRAPEGLDGDDGTVLDAVLDQAVALKPDCVALSGDLLDRTAAKDYSALRSRLENFHLRTRIQVIPVMGNHDELAPFLAGMAPLMGGAERRRTDSADHVRSIGGLQIVALDSTVPGEAFGALNEDQLQWLRMLATRPAPLGTCVVMHHPPIMSPMPQLRYSGFIGRQGLADVLVGLDIRVMLCGHYHYASSSLWGGHLVWSAPALAYHQDVSAPTPTVRGWPNQQFSLIDIDRESAVCTAVLVPTDDSQPTLNGMLDLEQKQRHWRQHNLLSPTP